VPPELPIAIPGLGFELPIVDKTHKINNNCFMELNIPPKYQKDIEIATNLLKKEGCKSIYLFGSLAVGKNHGDSDIDIGIRGFPKGKFFEICSKVYFAVDHDIDIVDFDNNADFYSLLNRLGEVIEIG
jgi:predicted nucleotidyltransferase